jgi:hypothetical protein
MAGEANRVFAPAGDILLVQIKAAAASIRFDGLGSIAAIRRWLVCAFQAIARRI